jgi:adenine/guanine phosphoribosyltransferase-like PRPP-binding protein
VSTVLGKHIPADPRTVYRSGLRLGALVRDGLRGSCPLVIGYAETATALGHVVATACGAPYLHSTRRADTGVAPAVEFEEVHSHATRHRLLPERPGFLDDADVVVLVDDELSTGQTVINTIAALHGRRPRQAYVVATLADVRGADDAQRLRGFATDIGAAIDVVSLGRGSVLSTDGPAGGRRLAGGDASRPPWSTGTVVTPVLRSWPRSVREGGRHGFTTADDRAARRAAARCAEDISQRTLGGRVLVLGTEELMYAPLLIALALRERLPARTDLRFSATTRSPVVVIDAPGYPVRTVLHFAAHHAADDRSARFAYNVLVPPGHAPFTDIVVVLDEAGETPALTGADGLLGQLRTAADRVHALVLPTSSPAAET